MVQILLSQFISIYQPDVPEHRVGKTPALLWASESCSSTPLTEVIVLQKNTDMKIQSRLKTGKNIEREK